MKKIINIFLMIIKTLFLEVTECISQYFEKFDKIKIAQKLVHLIQNISE